VSENVTVEYIEVPVFVTDAHGQPIRGLKKENFELRVNRRPRAIESFEAIDSRRANATPAQRPARERHLYLLMFDRMHTRIGLLARAQRAAIDFVSRSNEPSNLFAVATYTPNKGVQFVVPFLSDRAAVIHAIATLKIAGSDPLGLTMSDADRVRFAAPAGGGDVNGYAVVWGDTVDAEIASALRGGAAFQDMIGGQVARANEDFLENFGDLARRLAGLEGQKHVVLLSTGFDLGLIHGRGTPASIYAGGGVDARGWRILSETMKVYHSAGVFFDTIDLSGVSTVSESLITLAADTGGMSIHNRNSIGEALSVLTTAQELVYVLSFKRESVKGGTISVRVNGIPRDAQVSFRRGFGEAVHAPDIDSLQLIDILTNDTPQRGFNLTLAASPAEVALTIPREEIVAQAGERPALVDTLLYVFNEAGGAVFGGTKRADLSAATEDVVLRESLSLPPGRYVAKAVGRIVGTSSLGFAKVHFLVQ
jgi:VWFA-related protein